MQKHRTLKDVIKHIDDTASNALAHPTLFASSPVELENRFRSMENMRNFCLGIEDQNIANYSEFIQQYKACTSQGFTLTYLKNADLELSSIQPYYWELHNAFSEVWNEYVEWRDEKFKDAGVTIELDQ